MPASEKTSPMASRAVWCSLAIWALYSGPLWTVGDARLALATFVGHLLSLGVALLLVRWTFTETSVRTRGTLCAILGWLCLGLIGFGYLGDLGKWIVTMHALLGAAWSLGIVAVLAGLGRGAGGVLVALSALLSILADYLALTVGRGVG